MEPRIIDRIRSERRAVLSSLWTFVLLNMLFRDVHELLRPGAIEEFMASTVTEPTLLASGIVLSIFISMIVVTRILPRRLNRWANIGVAILVMGPMIAFPPNDLDDAWFLGVQVLGLSLIAGLAWFWRADDQAPVELERATSPAG